MQQPAMDAKAFAEMKDLMGDSFKEIISMCLQTLPEQLTEIKAAIQNNNAESLFNISHRMKSSCSSIGAFGLAEKAQAVELIGRNGSTEVPEQTLNELLDAANQVIDTLSAELNN